ncbi:MAG: cytochrome c biogenesis protein CcdA [Chloroflexi bacterium]|nr:cytochrome c biogenesis protein CcdA [Chloroflexota bacterium]
MIESFISHLAGWLPFGYAFTAGVVTMLSPCCIAMLPAYVSLHLGEQQEAFRTRSALWRGGRALVLSGAVTAGFLAVFGLMGAVLSLGGQAVMAAVPWLTVVIGLALIVLGIYLLSGGKVYSNLPARLAARIGGQGAPGIKAYLAFGIAYAIAALSCTIPIFLVVVGTAIAFEGVAAGARQFVSYALGMGLVITVVTLAVALFKEAVNRRLRRLAPLVGRFSGALLIIAGGYIVYYWFRVGNILLIS